MAAEDGVHCGEQWLGQVGEDEGNRQEKNAAVFEKLGAAVVIKDAALTPQALYAGIEKTLDAGKSAAMKKELKKIYSGNSAGNIVKILKGDI